MTVPHAVVSGASIAGLTTATCLARAGWSVTVIERAPEFRDGGQNVDVRGVARDVVHRLGLLEAVREQNTTEIGTVLVNAQGRVTAELPSDGPDGATAELEVLRGDLARTVLDHISEKVEIIYADQITDVEETDVHLRVRTESGRGHTADLLVVAEGVRSTTRDLVFSDVMRQGAGGGLRQLGITMAFGTIERIESDDRRWRWYTTTGGRQVHLRPDNHGSTRAILAYAEGRDLAEVDRDEAMTYLRKRFQDAGWQAQRVLDGFEDSDDVYVDDLAQVRLPTWSKGRVCLLGDSAWCVTPIGGAGASLALTGGYVLAAHLSGEPARTGEVGQALEEFERWMRPLVEEAQHLPPGIQRLAYPRTRLGLTLRGLIMKAVTAPPLSRLAGKLGQVAQTDQQLPDLIEADPPN